MRFRFLLQVACVLILASGLKARSDELPPAVERSIDFAVDVKPILEKQCWSCHGPEQRESGLRLDRLQDLLQGGDTGLAVVRGQSDKSRLIHYVAGLDAEHVMPPEGDRLTPQEIGVLRGWIDQGCSWPEDSPPSADPASNHWAYQPLKHMAPPKVANEGWVQHPIDRFILAELEKRGLSPSPEADRYTLIRRLYLDLLGLLPTVDEVDTFVRDEREDAYERLVDRLLKSPHFGERWGRHWLDMARYADSDGYEKDNARPDAYRWREWVIDAINADLPFDQFTIEQLAGDLLPDATPMQKLATAFHRQTLTNTEGGTDKEQFRVEACFDRTETTGAVWLGLTVGCARCHSHKYDRISQREYYQLFAIFNNGEEETVVVPKSTPEIEAHAAERLAYEAKVTELNQRMEAEKERRQGEFQQWLQQAEASIAKTAADPLQLIALEELETTADNEVGFKVQSDGSILTVGNSPDKAVYTLEGKTNAKGINAIRIDTLPDDSLPKEGPGRHANGNFVINEVTLEVASNDRFTDAEKLEWRSARADFQQAKGGFKAEKAIDGDAATGWAILPHVGKAHWLVLALQKPIDRDGPFYVRLRLVQQHGQQHTLGRFKVSLQAGLEPELAFPENILKLVATPAEKRDESQRDTLWDYFASLSSPTQEILSELTKLKKNPPPSADLTVRVIAQRKEEPRTTYVFKRGEFLDPIKELEAIPGGLGILPPVRARQEGAMADRLDLARWLVSPENPLTPRVTVNHVWRLLFGNGLVRTPSDFGVRGEAPSHPELLDWLAVHFIGLERSDHLGTSQSSPEAAEKNRSGFGKPWSRKGLIKSIVMSATYRQASRVRSELSSIDPQNVLLARQNRVRVEGEIVRDITLDAAGLLSRKIGGPSVYPPLPSGIAELSYAGNFKWSNSEGEDRYRRGMYTFFKRTSPHPNLTTFDCPDANLTCISRQVSNTPLQALTALNNEVFAEAARAFARRVVALDRDDRERLKSAFRIGVSRPPTEVELDELSRLLHEAQRWYADHSVEARILMNAQEDAKDSFDQLAAWTTTTRILLNLDEFLTRE